MNDYKSMDEETLRKHIVTTQRAALFIKRTTLQVAKMSQRYIDKEAKSLIEDKKGHGPLFHEITMMAFKDSQVWHDEAMACVNARHEALKAELVSRRKP